MPKLVLVPRSKPLPAAKFGVEYAYEPAPKACELYRNGGTAMSHQPARIESGGMRQANVMHGRQMLGARVPHQPLFAIAKRWDRRSGSFTTAIPVLKAKDVRLTVSCRGKTIQL